MPPSQLNATSARFTPYPEINFLLAKLLECVREILGVEFVGMYLDGSLATGDFDEDSDVDFVVVTENEISGDCLARLQTMHDEIAVLDTWWATQLEGSYISRLAIRRYDSTHTLFPNLERGKGERLKMVAHDRTWNMHRAILRERGITVAGPAPQSLIDPVTPDDLRQATRENLNGWATHILDEPTQINQRGYQSYVVLSLCRILYTLEHGTVVSKRVAAHWAQANLDARWNPLIERTWEGRHNPGSPASVEEVNETLAFIRFTLERYRQISI